MLRSSGLLQILRKGCLAIGLTLVFALMSPLHAQAESPRERLDDVKTAFEKTDYSRALLLGERLLSDGHLSPQLFQMLGHIRYRQGDLGRAALWYRRAMLFPPPQPELRQNLTHIKDKTGNVAFPGNGLGDQYSALMSSRDWLLLGTVAAWVAVFALAWFFLYTRRRSSMRPLLALIAVLALGTSAFAGVGWYWRPSYDSVKDISIVTTGGSRAWTAASTTSGHVMDLPVGSEVKRIHERGAWTYVEVPNPNTDAKEKTVRGWIQTDALTSFWPFDAGYLDSRETVTLSSPS